MKKIKLTSLLILCICSTIANAQYFVTKVSGKIKTSAGDYVRPGTSLKADEMLSWSGAGNKIWVVIAGKGEKIISPSPKAASDNDGLTEVLLSSLHQDSRSGSLSGRGEIIEKLPDALRTDAVNSNGKVIIEQENKYQFDTNTYPVGDKGVFFVEIDQPQQRPVIRTLKTVGDTLLISYFDLATDSYNPANKYSIGYHSKSSDVKDVLVVTFDPYFDLIADMQGIIASSVLAYQNVNNNKDVVRDSIYRNIYATIGKPNGLYFVNLFNQLWQNKGIVNNFQPEGGTGLIFNQEDFDKIPRLSPSVEITRGELPDNFSLRQYAPQIGNQGQTSSCVAWSAAYACRTITFAIQHNYSKTNRYQLIVEHTFAPDFIYNNIKTTADCNSGTALSDALNFMKKNGDVIKSGEFVCGRKYNNIELQSAQIFKIKDFTPLNGRGVAREDLIQKIKASLVSKNALPFGMYISNSFQTEGKRFGHLVPNPGSQEKNSCIDWARYVRDWL